MQYSTKARTNEYCFAQTCGRGSTARRTQQPYHPQARARWSGGAAGLRDRDTDAASRPLQLSAEEWSGVSIWTSGSQNAFADVGGKDVFSTYTFKVATPLETSSPEKRHLGGEGG